MLKAYFNSLDKTFSLALNAGVCGHGSLSQEPYSGSMLEARIVQIKDHMETRLSEILEYTKRHSHATGMEIAKGITWNLPGGVLANAAPMQRMQAGLETMSCLEYLIEEGSMVKRNEQGTWRFSAA